MSTKQLSQLPQLFRSPFLRKIALGNYYKELSERLQYAGLSKLLDLKLSSIFDRVYSILLQDYRCEYVFKNALMQNWFLSRHSTDRSFITDEFRVGESRVDLAVFAKKSVAFEIKTELDSPSRLAFQSSTYMKVFDLVYVVTSASMLSRLQGSIPKTVGILLLTASGNFTTFRASESHAGRTDLNLAFDCLRQSERVQIVENIYQQKITVPNSELYLECKRKFRKLLPFDVQSQIVQQIRNRTYPLAITDLMSEVPQALKHTALTLRATNQEVKRISEELKMIPRKPRQPLLATNEHILSISERKTRRIACA